MLEHPLAFLPFEALMAGLLFLCFRHALPFGAPALLKLAASVVFGILLEWATIEQLDAYRYGTQYLFMIDTVPIAAGVGWGVILYSAMYLTDHTNLNPWLRPVADALLALNIDLAMDAVAIRAGMWDWGKGLEHDYFGVPFENFWAWFWVIFCLSLQPFRRSPPSAPSRLPWLRCLRWAALSLVRGLVLGSVRLHLRPRLFRLLLKLLNSQFVIVIAAHKQLPTDSA